MYEIMYEDSNNNSIKELENQIPTEYNQEKTLRIIRKQNEIPGESRTKTLNDLTTAVEIGQVLKDLSFPVKRKIILTYVQDLRSTNPKANQILPILLKLNDNKLYHNVFDITSELGIIE
ncbi:MAG TPA: hypothetical protein VE548_02760 [Nitrososphaeraceae archaeon]|jgi:hypothetical protein|nr:hypothetical protein [Nitrososphaeraceae archaeon]